MNTTTIKPENQLSEISFSSFRNEESEHDEHNLLDILLYLSEDLKGVSENTIIAIAESASLQKNLKWSEIYDSVTRTIANKSGTHPDYILLAGKAMMLAVREEVKTLNVNSFTESIEFGYEAKSFSSRIAEFVEANSETLESMICGERDFALDYFGARTLYDRYLSKCPDTKLVYETPQYLWMRVACGISEDINRVENLYEMMSTKRYLPSSPTLFNSGTQRSQMSSCYLLDSPEDSIDGIYDSYKNIAKLSKFAGGIGVGYSRIRSRGSRIEGTGGRSNGIVGWLKTLDSSVRAVDQGGRRKGAACVYLETWHADIEEFLELRNNTGEEMARAHNLNIANWVPDIFMRRVEKDGDWSLFCPNDVPELVDLWGADFDVAYREAEEQGKARKTIKARKLYSQMMVCLAQTGNGWMTWKDQSNKKNNQTADPKNVVHLSNLCTEIVEVTDDENVAVCNLGSLNLSSFLKDGDIDYPLLAETTRNAVFALDAVIDRNFYPIPQAEKSNKKWRPVGLGAMGLQDLFFALNIPFDSERAREINRQIFADIYYAALSASCELAEEHGTPPCWKETRAYRGDLQFDLWGIDPLSPAAGGDWGDLKNRIAEHGLRNSMLMAIAPTATIASISGVTECIEPQMSNFFKRLTLSGEFLRVNPYLVKALDERGLWNDSMARRVAADEGSIANVYEIPEDLRQVFRTVWEIPQRSLIDMAVDRGAYICQSQSLNMFIRQPDIGVLSSMYMYAWKQGLKTTYYLHSRPATTIAKVGGTTVGQSSNDTTFTSDTVCEDDVCLACQ